MSTTEPTVIDPYGNLVAKHRALVDVAQLWTSWLARTAGGLGTTGFGMLELFDPTTLQATNPENPEYFIGMGLGLLAGKSVVKMAQKAWTFVGNLAETQRRIKNKDDEIGT